jgi:hypothetical protein
MEVELRRHAMVMNNIGVSLLERRCYFQALDTLKDSLSVIRSIAHHGISSQGCSQGDSNVLLDDAKTKQDCAIRRMSAPSIPSEYTGVNFESVCLSDPLPGTESFDAIVTSGLPPTYQLIRIDGLLDATIANECTTQNDDNNHLTRRLEQTESSTDLAVPNLESAVILHNLGLATFCISSVSAMTHPNYQSAGIQIIQSSYDLYIKAIHQIETHRNLGLDSQSSSSVCRSELLIGLTIVLNTLITSLLLASQENKAAHYQTILRKTRARIEVMNEAKQRFGLSPRNASAA